MTHDILADLAEIHRAVFGNLGDEPNVYADYDECTRLCAVMERTIAALQWQPITTAPDEQWVEVIGDSNMKSQEYFLCLAKRMPTYRPLEPWRGVQLDALSDQGWVPLYWRRPLAVPKVRP